MHAGATWVYEKPPDLDNIVQLLSASWAPPSPTGCSVPSVSELKIDYLSRIVRERGGVSQAARYLGIRRTTLQKMLRGIRTTRRAGVA
jgi:ActR/RegA family two-component response regulator